MKLFSPRENVSLARYADEFVIRRGIWNHLEIVFSRQEFVDNNSDYDRFVDLLEASFRAEGVDKEAFTADPYHAFIVEQLLQFSFLAEHEVNCLPLDPEEDNFAVIVEEKFVEEAKYILQKDVITVQELEADMSELLLSKKDYLAYTENVKTLQAKLPYDRLVVILTTPQVLFLHKFNRFAYEAALPWSLGLQDGNFLTMTAFNRHTTACFECLSQGNEVRMQGYINYLRYLEHERDYQHFVSSREDFLLMAALVRKLDSENLYDIHTQLEGMVLSIYTPTFEINTERLLRSPMCTTCGHVSVQKAQDYNITTRNALKEVLQHASS